MEKQRLLITRSTVEDARRRGEVEENLARIDGLQEAGI